MPGAEAVAVGFWSLMGSRDEDRESAGYSHFVEHMVFKGTARRSALDIARDIDRVGGVINAFTEKETVCIHATVPRQHLDLAIDVIVDMLNGSAFAEEEIAKEKSVVVNEIQGYLDSPEDCAFEAYSEGLWGDHPLARKITGDIADVKAIKRDRLVEFHRNRWSTARLTISVAGDLDPDALAARLAGALPAGPADLAGPADGEALPARVRPARIVERRAVAKRTNQQQIYLGTDFETACGNTGLIYGTLVMSTAFGESMSSRLFQELRETRGLCYTIGSFRTMYSDVSLWSVYASTAPEQSAELLDAVDGELSRLLAEPLSEQEVEDAKSHLIGSLIISKADVESRMKRLVRMMALVGAPQDYEESVEQLRAITTDKVAEISRHLLAGRTYNLTVYGGRKAANWKRLRFSY
jgi:predicted Zn-dependent peptidase